MKAHEIAKAKNLLAGIAPNRAPSDRQMDMVWLSRDGRELTPRQMKTSHLINCIRMLERRAAEVILSLKLDKKPAEVASVSYPIHDVMVEELERRLAEDKANKKQQTTLAVKVGRKFDV